MIEPFNPENFVQHVCLVKDATFAESDGVGYGHVLDRGAEELKADTQVKVVHDGRVWTFLVGDLFNFLIQRHHTVWGPANYWRADKVPAEDFPAALALRDITWDEHQTELGHEFAANWLNQANAVADKPYLLVEWTFNWADEFDVDGWQVMDGQSVLGIVHQALDLKRWDRLSDSFGTNEELTWENAQSFLNGITWRELTPEQNTVLQDLFGGSGGHTFPELPNDAEDYEDEEDDEEGE